MQDNQDVQMSVMGVGNAPGSNAGFNGMAKSELQ